MKKTLLITTLLLSMAGFKAAAQDTYTLDVFTDAIYYGMYEGTVSEPIPDGAIRNSNSSYGMKLTEDQIAAIGNRLTLNVTAEALCDDYDRIGNVNLAFVPKGSTSYIYGDVQRIEIGRFITPFMNNLTNTPTQVPYTFDIDNVTQILHDTSISSEFDFWIELEIYGYQGWAGAGGGGAAYDFESICADRNDVYKGSLTLESYTDTSVVSGQEDYFKKLSYKFELKDYVLATDTNNQGTDILDETTRSYTFTLDEAVSNAKFYLITSNHGSNSGGEEYKRRNHYIYLDNVQKLLYKPGENCEPYRQYNTMPNGIYGSTPLTAAQWGSFSNWCPGAKIPIRVIDLGDLAAGDHTFKINVPAAVFIDDQGYFPMSVYVQAYSETLATKNFAANAFTVSPNPVNDVATITVQGGQAIQSVSVINILGQVVLNTTTANVDLSSLQGGVYIVKVQFDNGQVGTQKVIKK